MRRIILMLLCVVMMMSFVGCGSKTGAGTQVTENESESITKSEGESLAGQKDVIKPASVTVMWDQTMSSDEISQFSEELSKKLGVVVNWVSESHSDYYDVLKTNFTNNASADIVVLSPKYYQEFAKSGYLWDMTGAWENSGVKSSGRFTNAGLNVVKNAYLENDNGTKSLYGMPYERGNGCITYVRTAWLEECNITVPTTYEEYYNMCLAFKEKYKTAPVTAPGFISEDAPYTNYLPEFYQDAYPDFYKNSEGKWVDGFTQEAMKNALTRLNQAYKDGLLDVKNEDNESNSTVDCRKGFINEEQGVFTYWAGTWAVRLEEQLKAAGVKDTRLTALKPIAEVGKYVEKDSYVIAISANANNPEGIFKYFIEPIFDGGEVQTLWTYGVEEVHWGTKKEKIYINGTEHVFEEGEFHFLLNKVGPSYDGLIIEDELLLAEFAEGKNPTVTAKSPLVSDKEKVALKFLEENSICEKDRLTGVEKEEEIWEYKLKLIEKAVTGEVTPEEAIEEYKNKYGTYVESILNR